VRRYSHAFLVGLLVVSMSADAALGCWYLRMVRPTVCGPVVARRAPPWVGGPVATVGEWTTCDERIECCCGVAHSEPADDVMTGSDGANTFRGDVVEQEIIDSWTVAGLVEASAIPNPAPVASSVIELPAAAVSEVESVTADVRRASVDEPAEPSALGPEPSPPIAPSEQTLAEEANLFELADAVEPAQEVSPAEPTRVDEPASETDGKSLDPDGDDVSEPANPLDAAERRTGEPARLWIDATGRHAVVGVLIDVRGDGICILDTGSEMFQVPAAALRRRDRDYAEQAAARLAVSRSPAGSDTVAR